MRRLSLTIILILFSLVPTAAQADLPTDRPISTTDKALLVASLEPVAESYWGLRGVSLPVPVQVYYMGETPEGYAFGANPGPEVWLTHMLFTRYARTGLCHAYLHERGHNAGLSHESGLPIMAPREMWTTYTPKCDHWVLQNPF